MKKNIKLIFMMLFFCSCYKKQSNDFKLQKCYIAKHKNDSLSVKFISIKDKIFLLYYFFYDDGNYLNTPLDSSDYAGFFYKKDIKKNQVVLKIRDYRGMSYDSTLSYRLKISFLTDSSFRWNIDRYEYGKLTFMPNDVVFISQSGPQPGASMQRELER